MNIGCDRIGPAESLAQPNDPFICVDTHPKNVVEVRKLHRFDGRNFHHALREMLAASMGRRLTVACYDLRRINEAQRQQQPDQ